MPPPKMKPWIVRAIAFLAAIVLTFTQTATPVLATSEYNSPLVGKPYSTYNLGEYEVTEAPVVVSDYDLLVALGNDSQDKGYLVALNTRNDLNNDGDVTIPPSFPGKFEGLTVNEASAYAVKGKALVAFALPAELGQSLKTEWFVRANEDLLPPVVAGDYVYLIDRTGKHYRVNRQQGQNASIDSSWTGTILAGDVSYPPVTDGRSLFYEVDNRYLIAMDLESGQQRWQFDLKKTICGPLMVSEKGFLGSLVCDYISYAGGGTQTSYSAVSLSTEDQKLQSFGLIICGSPYPDCKVIDSSLGHSLAVYQEHDPWLYTSVALAEFLESGTVNVGTAFMKRWGWGSNRYLAPRQYPSEAPNSSFLAVGGHTIIVLPKWVGYRDMHNANFDQYKTDISITAPPTVGPDGSVYITGQGSDGKYHVEQIKDMAEN